VNSSPPVLHRWEPGLATTRALLSSSVLAPHRSCTGGSPVWQLPARHPFLPPLRLPTGPAPVEARFGNYPAHSPFFFLWLPTGPAPVGARFGNYSPRYSFLLPLWLPTGPAPVEARFGNYSPRTPFIFRSGSPPVLHRWEPGLATTPRAPLSSSAPAPHRSCTGGSPVWQLPRAPLPPSSSPAPHRSCTGGSPVWQLLPRASFFFLSGSPPVLHRWEPGLATTRAPLPPSSSPAPHRSCTGGSPVWQLPAHPFHLPLQLPTGPAPVGARFGNYPRTSFFFRSGSPPVLHWWERWG
jgi:hypothetical protein